jgi:hypothetical protein
MVRRRRTFVVPILLVAACGRPYPESLPTPLVVASAAADAQAAFRAGDQRLLAWAYEGGPRVPGVGAACLAAAFTPGAGLPVSALQLIRISLDGHPYTGTHAATLQA